MKRITKLFAFCIIFGIVVLNGFSVKADEIDIDLSCQEAKKMAWLQVDSDRGWTRSWHVDKRYESYKMSKVI